jgi:tetratricopeptide (TPR) repeat protein
MRGKTSNRSTLLAILLGGIAWAQDPHAGSSLEAVAKNNEAVAKNNQAMLLAGQGREAEAEKLYRDALDAEHDNDLARAKIANNLAALYERQDRYRDAERMFHSALEWRRKNLPAASLEIAYSLNNLGEVYRTEGRDWEARNLMETALRSLEQFHPEAPAVPIVRSNFAIVLCHFGELDQAQELLRAALLTYDERRGTEGREYAVTLNDLGQVLEAKGDLEAAVPPYEQAIGIFEHLGVAGRIDLSATLANTGELYQRLDRIEDARRAEERALELLPPAGHGVSRSQILRNLGNIVAKAGNPAEALRYFEQSLRIHEKTLGADHPATASLLLEYSSASLRAGNKSLAGRLRKRATDLAARLKSQSPPQMTVSVNDLRALK